MTDTEYRLYYWPEIQGRGEFVRLVLEDVGAAYVDVARLPESDGGGTRALARLLDTDDVGTPAFAPPILQHGELYVSQTAIICSYLGERHGLAPEGDARWKAQHLQVTLADLVTEIHDTHHPISSSLYYGDQKVEAQRRASAFRDERLPKFLGYFERVLTLNTAARGRWLVGTDCSHADLSLFQVVSGLEYAFPNALGALCDRHPNIFALRDHVSKRTNIATYLASERRIPFNEYGIFRHYPELDAPA